MEASGCFRFSTAMALHFLSEHCCGIHVFEDPHPGCYIVFCVNFARLSIYYVFIDVSSV